MSAPLAKVRSIWSMAVQDKAERAAIWTRTIILVWRMPALP